MYNSHVKHDQKRIEQLKLLRARIKNNDYYYGQEFYFNITDSAVFEGENGLDEIEKNLTLKFLKNQNKIIIVIDQANKYCTVCKSIKNNLRFTNKTNKKLIKMSDLHSYIFNVCDDCHLLLDEKINEVYNYQFNNNPSKMICQAIFNTFSSMENIHSVQSSLIKIICNTQNRIYLENYFIIKCIFNKDITKYIFLFVETPKIYYHAI
jgi:hypothetical protein